MALWYYQCTVNQVGPATNGTETPDPVVYINLTHSANSAGDGQPAFSGQWFYVAAGGQNQMLAVALAAMNGQKHVSVAADAPNAAMTPYTAVYRMYLQQT